MLPTCRALMAWRVPCLSMTRNKMCWGALGLFLLATLLVGACCMGQSFLLPYRPASFGILCYVPLGKRAGEGARMLCRWRMVFLADEVQSGLFTVKYVDMVHGGDLHPWWKSSSNPSVQAR